MLSELKINYEFFPPPKTLKKKMRAAILTGNEYKIMDLIIDIMSSWPDTRQNFEKQLSGSYLAKNIRLSESAIYRAISGLIRKGFLAVVSEAKKGIGRVLKILTDDLQFSHIISGDNKKEKSIKEKQHHGVCPSLNNNGENKNSVTEVSTKTKPLPPSTILENKIIKNLPPPVAGVLPHAMKNGIAILQKRGISDLAAAVKAIGQEMKDRTIVNINGYFTSLCKTIDFNHSASSPTPFPPAAVPQESNIAAVAKKAQEENDRKFKEEDKIQEKPLLIQWQELEEKYPDKTGPIKKEIDNSPMGRKVFLEILKTPLYIEEFKKIYGDSGI